MAPLPPSSTARFKFHYTTIGNSHTLQIRSGGSPSAVGALVDDLFTAFSTLKFATTMDSVEFAVVGSDVFNPVVTGIEGNTYGSGAGTQEDVPRYDDFIGRTAGGKRVRITVFGVGSGATDYRYAGGENADIDACIAILVAAGSLIKGIDGLTPTWKSYANQGYNVHWQKAQRPG